ncbi:MAG: hypothetical protein ACK5BQ_03935 [Ignavibacteria bacterium]|jgi:hypothetical protein
MKLLKTIGLAVIAIIAAMVVWSILSMVLSLVFKVTMFLVKVALIGLIAVPFFLYLRHKLLSSK